MVNGIKQKPIEGVSMVYTFDKANANAPSKRDTQYFEMVGNRAHLSRRLDRRDDAARCALAAWLRASCPTCTGYKWELYNIAEDYSREQRPRRENAGQAQGNAGVVPDRSGEIQRLPAG